MNHLKNKPILFEFRGTVSQPCRRYLLRKLSVRIFVTALAMLLVGLTLTTILVSGVLMGDLDAEFLRLMCPINVVVALLGSGLCAALVYTKKEQAEVFPERICFLDDEDNTVVIESPKEQRIEYSDLFRKVVDMGDFYYIDHFAKTGRGYICEKALMTQGSVEAFERLLEGKIEKKDGKK